MAVLRMSAKAIAFAAASFTYQSLAYGLEISERFVSDFDLKRSTAGVAFDIPGKVFIGVKVSLPPVVVIHAIADLDDLQRKIPAIVSTIKLPSDNCASYNPKNAVVTLSASRLSFVGGKAVFHAEGTAVIWSCLQNPVPNTKVDFEIKNVGLGIKTKVPVIHTWPGNPIKAVLGSQPFSIDAPFDLKVAGGGALQLVPGEAHIDLGGQYVEITKSIIHLFKVDLDSKLNDAMQKALDPKALTASIPEEFIESGFAFKNASFIEIDNGKSLGLDMSADVTANSKTAKESFKLLYEALKAKI